MKFILVEYFKRKTQEIENWLSKKNANDVSPVCCIMQYAQAVGGKRLNENDKSHHDGTEEPPEKMGRFELDDSDDESSVCLPSTLENFVRKYIRKHVGDKAIKERVLTDKPVPGNVDRPPQ